jgi:hypothetical protein
MQPHVCYGGEPPVGTHGQVRDGDSDLLIILCSSDCLKAAHSSMCTGMLEASA